MIGQNIIAGVKFEAGDYGVPVTLGAGDGIYLKSQSLQQIPQVERQAHYSGKTKFDLVKKGEEISGKLTLEPRYADMRLLMSALGLSAPGYSPVALAGDFYEHFTEPSAQHTRTPDYFDSSSATPTKLRSRFTLLVGDSNQAYQYDGCFANGFTLQMNFDSQSISFPVSARYLSIDDATNPDIDDLTLPASSIVKLLDGTVYIKLLEGLTLTASKTFSISDSGGSASITIPAGKYSYKRIASFLTTQLNQNGTLNGRYSCKYDSVQRRFLVSGDESSTVSNTGTISSLIGFTRTSTGKINHVADSIPQTAPAAWTASNKVGVSGITLTYTTGSSSKETAYSYPWKDEPEQGINSLSIELQIPRYSDNGFISEGSSGGEWEIMVQFTEPTSGEELEFIIPCAVMSSCSASLDGPGISFLNLSFNAVLNGHFFNPATVENPTSASYLWRISTKGLSAGDSYTVIGSYQGKIHAVGNTTSGAFFKRIESNALSSDLGNYSITWDESKSMIEHRGLLYLSEVFHPVFSWNGTVLINIYNGISDYFVRMVSWGGLLWGIEHSTGYLKSYDAVSNTWTTQNTFGGSTLGYDLCEYNGHLYCLIKKSSTTRLYKFIVGTGASEIHDFAGDYANAHLCVFDQKVYAVANTALLSYDGSNKVTNTTDESASWMFAYNGHLCFVSTTDSGVYYYDFANGQFSTFYGGSFTAAPTNRGIVFNGRIIFPCDDSLMVFSGIPLVLIRIKNEISSNPMS